MGGRAGGRVDRWEGGRAGGWARLPELVSARMGPRARVRARKWVWVRLHARAWEQARAQACAGDAAGAGPGAGTQGRARRAGRTSCSAETEGVWELGGLRASTAPASSGAPSGARRVQARRAEFRRHPAQDAKVPAPSGAHSGEFRRGRRKVRNCRQNSSGAAGGVPAPSGAKGVSSGAIRRTVGEFRRHPAQEGDSRKLRRVGRAGPP